MPMPAFTAFNQILVIDDDEFVVGIVLIQQRLNALVERRTFVATGNHHRTLAHDLGRAGFELKKVALLGGPGPHAGDPAQQLGQE